MTLLFIKTQIIGFTLLILAKYSSIEVDSNFLHDEQLDIDRLDPRVTSRMLIFFERLSSSAAAL